MTTTTITRTQDEILARINERRGEDLFGFEWHEYLIELEFERAVPFFKEDTDRSETAKLAWEKDRLPCTRENQEKRIREYMTFAWEKANGCRGISANRSVMHFVAWAWLAGDDAFLAELEAIQYQFYGKPKLVKIARKYGVDWRALDDGHWTNVEGDDGMTADVALALVGMELTP